jgi:hypothetical protein
MSKHLLGNFMKTTSSIASCLAALALSSAPLQSAIYNDSVGDIFTGAGGGILDIVSVEVSHNATDLIFKVNLAGDPVATDWGKYMIGLDTAPGGDASGNGWGRPIGMSSGMNYWIGTWADSGNGAEVRSFDGSIWNLQSATWGANPDAVSLSKDSSSVTIQFNYGGLGLINGSSFYFDVYSSGGGGTDGAIDALSNPNQTVSDWGDYYNSGSLVSLYTIPEPTSAVLLGFGALLMLRRFIGRRN